MKPNKRCFQRMVSEIMGNTHVLLNGNNAVTNLYKQKDGDNLQQSFMWEVTYRLCQKWKVVHPYKNLISIFIQLNYFL